MKISIIGLGWYGSRLAEELLKDGHNVRGTTRSEEKKKTLQEKGIFVEVINDSTAPQQVTDADLVVLNIPPFEGQLSWFKSWHWQKETWIIFISSTSVYPTPDSRGGELLLEEEKWVAGQFKNWTVVRFGGLIGEDRHPGKYLSGRQNLAGKNWPVNLIHLEDCVGLTKAIIEGRLTNKIINAVADDHPTREEYYTKYCRVKDLPLPHFNQSDETLGKLVPNEEMKKFYRPRIRL